MKLALAATALTLLVPAPALAATVNGYDKPARSIAEVGDCKNVRRESTMGVGIFSSAVCDLRGRKVEILTFSKKVTEARFVYRYCGQLPEKRVMLGAGFVILGSNRSVGIGARVYRGDPYLCSDIV